MYLVTSRDKHGANILVWKYRNRQTAWDDYLDLKKHKYPGVHISQVIK